MIELVVFNWISKECRRLSLSPTEIQLDPGNPIPPGLLPAAWQTLPGGNVQHVVGLREPSTVPTSHCDIACGVWKDYILSEHSTSPMPETRKGSNHPASMRGTKENPKYKPKALAGPAAAAGSSFPSPFRAALLPAVPLKFGAGGSRVCGILVISRWNQTRGKGAEGWCWLFFLF